MWSHGDGDDCAVPAEVDAGNAGDRAATSGVVLAAAAANEEVSNNIDGDVRTVSGGKKRLPLPLQPLAGRCWFENCGKVREMCRVYSGIPGKEFPKNNAEIQVLAR